MANTYAEKLKDPRWQKKRLEILQRDNFTCQSCLDDESMLVIHHMLYESKNPWETDSKYLITLCQSCHNWQHENCHHNEKDLITHIKGKGFLSSDFRLLAEGFQHSASNIPARELSKILHWALSSGEMSNIRERYLKYLRKMNKSRKPF